MMEIIQEKNDLTMNYKFQNVIDLTLLIYKEWPIGLIYQILKHYFWIFNVNVSSVQH
ncbi:hypothetical protein I4U23_004708 [Adineta vaga]|nr:hypothetical protein I4U23_004708 [Adineta vaga]